MHNLKKELTNAWHIALLKKPVMHHVAEDKGKTIFGYYIIIASVLLSFIGMQLFLGSFGPTLTFGISSAVVQLVSIVVGIYALSFVAKKLFKGHAKHEEFFRVMAYGMIVTWVGIVPHLSPIGGIWALVIIFVVLRTVHKLDVGGTIGTMLVTLVIMFVVSAALSSLSARMGFGSYMNSGFKYDGYMNMGTKGMKMDTGDAKVEFGGDTMKITTEEGKTIEWKIPTVE